MDLEPVGDADASMADAAVEKLPGQSQIERLPAEIRAQILVKVRPNYIPCLVLSCKAFHAVFKDMEPFIGFELIRTHCPPELVQIIVAHYVVVTRGWRPPSQKDLPIDDMRHMREFCRDYLDQRGVLAQPNPHFSFQEAEAIHAYYHGVTGVAKIVLTVMRVKLETFNRAITRCARAIYLHDMLGHLLHNNKGDDCYQVRDLSGPWDVFWQGVPFWEWSKMHTMHAFLLQTAADVGGTNPDFGVSALVYEKEGVRCFFPRLVRRCLQECPSQEHVSSRAYEFASVYMVRPEQRAMFTRANGTPDLAAAFSAPVPGDDGSRDAWLWWFVYSRLRIRGHPLPPFFQRAKEQETMELRGECGIGVATSGVLFLDPEDIEEVLGTQPTAQQCAAAVRGISVDFDALFLR
ncbi:uncharacterized protein JN550_011145 [Neoarthrinium moseri]|uniref:uncharacterized protein n=1 Tax=Neoarthrinium moseri TaxID=1658444 RepID=UPI001FDDCE3C|nr:uncharacterized protein JN550_011145 [Neoarthrinium moseri]KAI1860990.1 hypothetical protein JN550_011145 [Neoarthrinium moseri]